MVVNRHNYHTVDNINNGTRIGDTDVSYVSSYLYRHIGLDEHRTFRQYHCTLYSIVSYKVYILRNIRPLITLKAALDVTKAIVVL